MSAFLLPNAGVGQEPDRVRHGRLVYNKTLSPYQPGSRTILYDSLAPTDANGHIARHSAWCADATSDGFVPNCLRLRVEYIGSRSPIGASDRLM